MDTLYIDEARKALEQLNKLKSSSSKRLNELSAYDSIQLISSPRSGRTYYYAKDKGHPGRRYLGGESNQDVLCIREQRYLKQLTEDIDLEISLITDLINRHTDIGFESVSSRLPQIYRQNKIATSSSEGSDSRAAKWKAEKEAEKSLYPVKEPEHLKMRAIDGTQMRSKSEVIIANLLIANEIPYVYELPHLIDGVLIYTDFTALSTIDYVTEVMIEHEGLMVKPYYQAQFLSKVNSYLADDLIPGRDIFFTFEDLRGGFDPSPVQDIINTRLKP